MGIQVFSNKGTGPFPRKFNNLKLLQNHWANFNQTCHQASLGKGDSNWCYDIIMAMSKCVHWFDQVSQLSIVAHGPLVFLINLKSTKSCVHFTEIRKERIWKQIQPKKAPRTVECLATSKSSLSLLTQSLPHWCKERIFTWGLKSDKHAKYGNIKFWYHVWVWVYFLKLCI